MKIRKATEKDVDDCFRLSHQEKEKYWRKQDFKNQLANKNVEFFVCEDEGKVVGYSSGFIVPTKQDEALMHETRADVKHRGKKIGSKLVKKVTDALFKRGAKTVYAMVEPELLPFYRDACKFKQSHTWIELSKKRKR